MKVNKPSSSLTSTDVGQSRSRAGGAPVAPPPPSAQESVDITPLSTQLQALEATLSGSEVVDSAKVEAIKTAISEGRFRINPEVIADRLLAAARELVAGRSN